MVTPVWGVLVLGRVMFYTLQRLRFPDIVPPVSTDAIQGILMWPLVVLGCYLTLTAWRRRGLHWAVGTALITALVFGSVARMAYGVASFIGPARLWEGGWSSFLYWLMPSSWTPWLSNLFEYSVPYLSCVTAVVGVLSYRSLVNERLMRSRMETIAERERLRTLRAQLNPHFLFNTLNSIASLSEAQSPSASQLVGQLSELLRHTLRASEHEEHQLSQELRYAETYLQIQQVRHPSRIDWQVQASVECKIVVVPSLILQSLVENAVTHGLRGGSHPVRIEVHAALEDTSLLVTVRNSCRVAVAGESTQPGGIGLRNVSERLEVLFGAQATLLVHRPHPNQFEVQVRLPLGAPCATAIHSAH